MKHINLEEYISYELGKLVRPSKSKAIEDALWDKGIRQYKDLCAMKEKDFKNLSFVDDTFLAKTKAHLEEYGLRFGMTEDEIIEYMDNEYFLEHPEERPAITIIPGVSNGYGFEVGNPELEKRIEDAIKAEGVEELPLPKWSEQECREQFIDKFRYGTFYGNTNSDYEWFKYRSLYVAFMHQPWYYRFLYDTNERIRLAKEEADKLMGIYTEDIIKQNIDKSRRSHEADCKRIREQNEQNGARRQAIREEQSSQYRDEFLKE